MIFLVLAMLVSVIFAADRKVNDYLQHGSFDYQLVQTAFDSNGVNFKSNIVAIIDTVSFIAMKPVQGDFGLSVTANDTNWYFICGVPTGMTATLRSIYVTCETEPNDNGNTDGRFGFVFYDASKADTVVKLGTERPLDADSASLVAGNLTAFSLDSVTALAAGDIVFLRTWADTANLVLDGGGFFVDIDYNE